MKRTILFLTGLLLAGGALAADVVECDPSHSAVAHAFEALYASAHTPDHQGMNDRVINPDLSALSGVASKYWKCSGGDGVSTPYTSVVEMTAGEKSSMDTFLAPDPNPEKILVQSPDETVKGGMQARQNDNVVRMGSQTASVLYLAYNNTNYAALGQGGRWLLGSADTSLVEAEDTLVVDGRMRLLAPGSTPTCDATLRNMIMPIEGGAGVADQLVVCQKNAADIYAWRDLWP